MQSVPALTSKGIPTELAIARRAPHIGRYAVLLEKGLRFDYLVHDGSAPEQMRLARQSRLALFEAIETLQNPVMVPRVLGGHLSVLISDRQVIEDVLLGFVHPSYAITDNHNKLEREGRIVADEVGNSTSDDMRMTVLVLKTLTS